MQENTSFDAIVVGSGITGGWAAKELTEKGLKTLVLERGRQVEHVKSAIEGKWNDRKMTIGRIANLTREHNGRPPCQHRNLCYRGCPYGAYFSSNSATLPAAAATGNLTLRPDSVVESVLFDKNTRRATGVRVIDANTGQDIEYKAKLVFLCASTLGSTFILLNSDSEEFPDGLANSSGALGKYLMDHDYSIRVGARMEGFDDKYYNGARPNGIYIPRFRNIEEKHPDFLRGYGFQGGGSRTNWNSGFGQAGFGADFKDKLTHPGPWSMRLVGFGECLPYEDNSVSLNKDVLDKHGLPTLKISATFRKNEHAMREDIVTTASEMLEAAGGKDIQVQRQDSIPGFCIHEMGTARMGRDPKTSVLNKWNQAHDVDNLFVTDGACMASSACQNPSITYMALTARAVDYAVKELKNGNI